ncbi:MAG: rhodanese-like domain-containing protein [Brevinematia bacterium]
MKKIQVDIVIDLRAPEEFEKDKGFYHSLGVEAINLDFFKAPKEIESFDKEKSYFVVCNSGVFSEIISKLMLSKGFKNVKDFKGGIEEFRKMLDENQ